jgi:hypothetical protein
MRAGNRFDGKLISLVVHTLICIRDVRELDAGASRKGTNDVVLAQGRNFDKRSWSERSNITHRIWIVRVGVGGVGQLDVKGRISCGVSRSDTISRLGYAAQRRALTNAESAAGSCRRLG